MGIIDEIGKVESAEIEVAASLIALRAAGESAESTGAGRTSAGVGFRCGGIDVVGVEADLIVDLALLGIAEDFVGLGDGLEFLFRRFVAGIDVGVVFAASLRKALRMSSAEADFFTPRIS